jgi:serine/threonine protein kinase
MEYVSGGTLAKHLRGQAQANAQIPLNRAIEMMIDIAQGARAINEKLIHRDIKTESSHRIKPGQSHRASTSKAANG